MGLRFTIKEHDKDVATNATSEQVRRYLSIYEPNSTNAARKLAVKVAVDSGSWVSNSGIYVELERPDSWVSNSGIYVELKRQ